MAHAEEPNFNRPANREALAAFKEKRAPDFTGL